MPPPQDSNIDNGDRLSGMDICNYMENFTKKFLDGKAKFLMETEVLNIERDEKGKWKITAEDLRHGSSRVLIFSRIILATGVCHWPELCSLTVTFSYLTFQGCSAPKIPSYLSQEAADKASFRGLIIHSSQFASHLDKILDTVKVASEDKNDTVLVVGGGKSAQE